MEERPEADANSWQSQNSVHVSAVSQGSKTFTREDCLLQYIPQNDETRSNRPVIPTTRLERLSYFRGYTSTPSKTQIVCKHHINFDRFFWSYILLIICKSLPHTFVYIFLAFYAPDEHFFVAKMVPILSGIRVAYILAAIIDITSYIDAVIWLLDYSIFGLVYKTPWNRCPTNQSGFRVNCYVLEDFVKKFENYTPVFKTDSYVSSSGELFQMAPLYYQRNRLQTLSTSTSYGSLSLIYFLFLWIVIALHYKQLNKKYIWKALHMLQMVLCIICLFALVHLSVNYFLSQNEDIVEIPANKLQSILWEADVDMIAESMVTPPTVHMLTARSSQEIHPTRDSAIIIFSNAIYYIFRSLTSYKVKRYCDSLIRSPLFIDMLNQHSFFFIWPIYFSRFYFGDIYCNIFFILNFFMEFYILVVTFHCLVEAIVCEWHVAKRIVVTIVVAVVGLLWFAFSTVKARIFLYVITKGFVTLLEIYGLYIIYPLGRLIADITFYNGLVLTNWQAIIMSQVPFWYTIYFGKMLHFISEMMAVLYHGYEFYDLFYWGIAVVSVPLLIGAMLSIFFYVFKKKKSWTSLFRPDDSWGPAPHIRQLRKLYESRDFVGSQAPRALSRYMMRRAKSKVYNIDIPYDSYKSTIYETRTENERQKSNI